MKRRASLGEMGRFWAGLALGLSLAIAALLLDLRAQEPYRSESSAPPTADLAADSPGTGTPTAVPHASAGAVRILVLGVDERSGDAGRSDTMLLAQIQEDQVRLLSIPRDTKVSLPGHGESKINAAYAYGGVDLAVQAVEALLDLPVDYYLKVNTGGFARLVDLIGGVPFTVPKAMYYTDPTDELVIDLKPGPQVLDGRKAEEFVRFRYDGVGDDLGRIRRQQEFLKAAAAHALTPANWPRLPALLYASAGYTDTNLPLTRQITLARATYKAAEANSLITETLPGHGTEIDGISFFVVDQSALDRLLPYWR